MLHLFVGVAPIENPQVVVLVTLYNPTGVNTGKYVTSFIGVAPTNEPQVTILVTLYNPTGEGGHQGGEWFI